MFPGSQDSTVCPDVLAGTRGQTRDLDAVSSFTVSAESVCPSLSLYRFSRDKPEVGAAAGAEPLLLRRPSQGHRC